MVGFGGGSPIDSAKAVAVLATRGGTMRDYKAPHVQDDPGLPVIAIPTYRGHRQRGDPLHDRDGQ